MPQEKWRKKKERGGGGRQDKQPTAAGSETLCMWTVTPSFVAKQLDSFSFFSFFFSF